MPNANAAPVEPTKSFTFIRYNEDDDTELDLEVPYTTSFRRTGRFTGEVAIDFDYTEAWCPESETWIKLTEDEQVEVSELGEEARKAEQDAVDAEGEAAAEAAAEPW